MHKFTFIAALLCSMAGTTLAGVQTPATTSLRSKLNDADVKVQLQACRELSQLGPKAKQAVPDLAELLSGDHSFELKRCAALAIAAIGPDAKAAVPALTAALKSKQAKLRAYAALALGRIGASAAPAIPELMRLVTDKDADVRRAVRDAVPRIGVSHKVSRPLLIAALKLARPEDAAAAVATFTELGDAIVPDLCDALQDKDACYWACLALAELGPKAKPAVPQLTKLLDSGQPEVRMQALLTLARIGPAAKSAASKIATILRTDKFESVQYAAAYALGCLGDRSVVGVLEKSLDSKDEFLRVTAAWALLRLQDGSSPLLKKAVAIIVKGIRSKDAHVRDAAARAAADESVPEKAVGPAFREALEGIDDPDQLMEIANALASTGKKIVPACIRSLEEKRKLRFYALQILIQLGPDAADAVPALIKTLDDPDPTLRHEAEFALGAIGPKASAAVPSLVARLSDDVDDVRYGACYALGKIGPASRTAAWRPLVKMAQHSKDEFSRVAAIWALLQIAPDNPRLQEHAVPILIKALADARAHVRAEVAGELGDIGAPAISALNALKKMAQEDDNPAVRKVAAAAVAKITKGSK